MRHAVGLTRLPQNRIAKRAWQLRRTDEPFAKIAVRLPLSLLGNKSDPSERARAPSRLAKGVSFAVLVAQSATLDDPLDCISTPDVGDKGVLVIRPCAEIGWNAVFELILRRVYDVA